MIRPNSIKDLTDLKYGLLLVKEFNGFKLSTKGIKEYLWTCQCDCGKTTVVRSSNLTSGKSKSCGCMKGSLASGIVGTPLYNVLTAVKGRCLNPDNPSYKNYGGRGITVCEEWLTNYQKFIDWANSNGYEEGLTLDRKNNNLGYFPENCRWTTLEGQARNKRKSLINKTGVTGVSKTNKNYISSWSENGKQLNKYFSINKYGENNAFELAKNYRKFKIEELNRMGYGYSEHHGL